MNSDYAPVVDVDSGAGAAGGELGGRMFGSTSQQVTSLASAFLTGLQQDNQVVGCLKHFPGLGDVGSDPHHSLFVLNRSLADLQRIDWAPYQALINSGQVGMIMSTHVILASVDPSRPATLSRPVITGILRDQLHYNGVIITDAYDAGRADEALAVLHQAVVSGAISKQQIDDSVRRILLLKLRYGILHPTHA